MKKTKKPCKKHEWKEWSEGKIPNVGPVKGYECKLCQKIRWLKGETNIEFFELTFEKKVSASSAKRTTSMKKSLFINNVGSVRWNVRERIINEG